jgi:hypothetical protein
MQVVSFIDIIFELFIMIFIDRLIRIISKDIYLPVRCYASKEQMFTPGTRCTCQTFCRKPSGGSPQPVYLESKVSPKEYEHMISIQDDCETRAVS